MLSLFGLAMAIATVAWIPEKVEGIFWLIIFLINAYFLAKNLDDKYFLNGFMVSIFNCVYIVALHVLFYKIYMEHHPDMAQMMAKKKMHFFNEHPRIGMIITGPFIGIALGLVQGLFAWLASKVFKKSAPVS